MKKKSIGESSGKKEKNKNKKTSIRKILFIISLFILLFLLAAISVTVGSYPITVTEVYSIVLQGLFQNVETTKEIVVWNLRLPRILMGIAAGIGLGIAGSIMQGVLKNSLASPYTLGISSGAGFGAVIAVILGAGSIPIIGGYFVMGIAFLFAFIISLFILYLANRIGATPFGIVVIVVVGIAIMWLLAHVQSLLLYFCEPAPVNEAMFWSVGSLGRVSLGEFVFHLNVGQVSIPFPGPVPTMLVVCCILLLISLLILKLWDFDAICIGVKPENSPDMGAKHIRILLMAIASLFVASVVSFTGAIAFIGLIAPHIAYVTVGKDNRFLLPTSGLLGALLVVGADIVARVILAPVVLPVSRITALVGVPLFIYLLIKMILRSSEV